MITVTGASDNRRVVLWEKSELHPGGEVFVVNDGKSYSVGETPAVRRALAEGTLLRVEKKTKGRESEPQP